VVKSKWGCLLRGVGDHGHELHWRRTRLPEKAHWAYGRNLYAEHVGEEYRAHSRIVRPSQRVVYMILLMASSGPVASLEIRRLKLVTGPSQLSITHG